MHARDPVICFPPAREPHFKAALIDALFKEGWVDEDTVIISEMPVASASRRADLVLANGKLLGFEIKTDGDSISRLAGQISAYQRVFEGTIVIAGERHVKNVVAQTPPSVGVFVLSDTMSEAVLVRRPHVTIMTSEVAIQHLTATDLHRLLRLQGHSHISRDRASLVRYARAIPPSDLRRAAIAAIKSRYRDLFQRFCALRVHNGSQAALPSLRKPAWNTRSMPELSDVGRTLPIDTAGDLASLELSVRPRRVG